MIELRLGLREQSSQPRLICSMNNAKLLHFLVTKNLGLFATKSHLVIMPDTYRVSMSEANNGTNCNSHGRELVPGN